MSNTYDVEKFNKRASQYYQWHKTQNRFHFSFGEVQKLMASKLANKFTWAVRHGMQFYANPYQPKRRYRDVAWFEQNVLPNILAMRQATPAKQNELVFDEAPPSPQPTAAKANTKVMTPSQFTELSKCMGLDFAIEVQRNLSA